VLGPTAGVGVGRQVVGVPPLWQGAKIFLPTKKEPRRLDYSRGNDNCLDNQSGLGDTLIRQVWQ